MSTPIPKIDPEYFRRQVGQYNDRWYHDPLPADDTWAEDLEWQGPSVSTVKKASGKDWTNASIKRLADWMHKTRPDWDEYQPRDIAAKLNEVSQAGLHQAFERGTQLHAVMENYADGLDPFSSGLGPEAEEFRGSMEQLLERERPEIALQEFVCLSRTSGYGGTADAIWVIDGEYWLVDYKSRNGRHTVYLEEGMQGGAYGRADYWVVSYFDEQGEVQYERMEPLPLAGGLIVSITREDYRIREFDIDRGFESFSRLLELWRAKSAGIGSVFGGWRECSPMPEPEPIPVSAVRDTWVRRRIERIKETDIQPLLRQWPEGVPTPKNQPDPYNEEQIDQLVVALVRAEMVLDIPWPETDPKILEESNATEQAEPVEAGPEPDLDEGDQMPGALDKIRERFDALSSTSVNWVQRLVKEAADAGVPFRVAEMPTARRVFISRALILACERRTSIRSFTDILVSVLGESDIDPDWTLGHLVGCLTWEQASVVAGLVSMTSPAEQDQPSTEPNPIALGLASDQLNELSKPDLKEQCRERGLPVGGTKQDLIQRLLG